MFLHCRAVLLTAAVGLVAFKGFLVCEIIIFYGKAECSVSLPARVTETPVTSGNRCNWAALSVKPVSNWLELCWGGAGMLCRWGVCRLGMFCLALILLHVQLAVFGDATLEELYPSHLSVLCLC